MSEQVPTKDQLSQAWDDLNGLVAFAYEQGFHELGYSPLNVIDNTLADARRENVRWENAHKVVMAERELWKSRSERINGLVLRLNADEGLSPGALAGLQRLAQAAGGAAPEPPAEPDMLHPKIQALIAGQARLKLELHIVESMLQPGYEADAIDGEYWTQLHDKLAARLAQPPGAGQ